MFGFFVLPFVFTIVAYLNASMFYAALQINKPFVNTLWVVLPVYIIEAGAQSQSLANLSHHHAPAK